MTDNKRSFDVAYRLLGLGVSGARVTDLMNNYSLDLIEKQLNYLSFRNATRPEAMIIEAIRKNYSAPKSYYAQNKTNATRNRGSLDEGAELSPRHVDADPQGHRATNTPDSTSPNDGLPETGQTVDLDLPTTLEDVGSQE